MSGKDEKPKTTRDKLIDEFFNELRKQCYPEWFEEEDILPSFDYSYTKVYFDLPKEFIVNLKKGVKLDPDLYLW